MIIIIIIIHSRHILPPSEIDGGCFWLRLQAQEGNIYFTELAERVEYGNYVGDSILIVMIILIIVNKFYVS